MTNNIAELSGLLAAIEHLKMLLEPDDTFVIFGDSKLAVNLVTGNWKCHAPHLISLRDEAQSRLYKLVRPRFQATWDVLRWCPRADNARADELSRDAYREATGKEVVERVRH